MTVAIGLVVLVAVVAFGRGGYAPWATFALELGAALLGLLAVALAFGRGDAADAVRARYRAWKKLPFGTRHPFLARCLRGVSLGKWPRSRGSADVEILLPGRSGDEAVEVDVARDTFVLGRPFKRTGLGAPLLLLTVWIALSLLPLGRGVVAMLSPTGERLRAEAEALVGIETAAAPWSLVPFLSARSLWIWLAVLALFLLTVSVARRPEAARTLGLSFLFLGVVSGAYGLLVWFEELRAAYGVASEALRVRGSFGNPNHYASFQSMLFLFGLGWVASLRAAGERPPRVRREPWNDRAIAAIGGLGLLLAALGLVLSLSRSGLTSCLAGGAVFLLITREPSGAVRAARRASMRAYAAMALAVLGFTVWIGIEPLVGRFATLDDQWEVEGTRIELWWDALPAVGDFWLTGSGLSSFRYVGAVYRSFGGRTYYSWAHNDYLQLAIELGLPGLLLLLWLGAAFVRAAKRVREDLTTLPSARRLHAGAVAAVVAVALHSATDFSLHLPANLALLAVLAAVAVSMEPPGRGFRREASR